MNNEELIASGELEFYVAGLLSEERNAELDQLIREDDSLKKEVEAIEHVVMRLAKEATSSEEQDFSLVLKKIVTQKFKVSQLNVPAAAKQKKVMSMWLQPVIGWVAAATFLIFFLYQYQNTSEVKAILSSNLEQKELLEQQIEAQIENATLKEDLLKTVASINTKKINLEGQAIAPETNVSVFWNTQKNKIIVDASQLPVAPEAMVYQIWSLKLDPLTPTSLGLLENYSEGNSLFSFDNPNQSEAFGITLEPAGGSQMPTLEQLYVLGTNES